MLTELFTNLREQAIASRGIEFAEESTPYDSLRDLRELERRSLFVAYQDLLNFGDTVDFAVVKEKNCTKGYSCGKSCISPTKNCRNPLEGQAKNYADFLKLQKGVDGDKAVKDNRGTKADITTSTAKDSNTMNTATITSVPSTEIARLDRGDRLVAVKKIKGIPQDFDSQEIDNLAQSILQNKTQFPVIVQRNGAEFDLVSGGKAAAAMQRAREIDPRAGEKASVFIANNDAEVEALKYQAQFLEEPSSKSVPPKVDKRVIDKVNVDQVGQSQLASVKRIAGGEGNFDADTIENLAQSHLKAGNIMPIVVQRDGTGFKLVSGELALAAARRAREIDPKAGEKTRVFIANNDAEAEALKYQAGKEKR